MRRMAKDQWMHWHNGPMNRRTRRSRMTVLGAMLLAPALVLAGCGGSKAEPQAKSSPSPTPSVSVPAGVTLTDPGAKLGLGDKATVPYRPDQKRGSVLELTVTKIIRADVKDFAIYVLDKRAKASTPYYVQVKVANVGTGDVGGTDVPLWAVDQRNTLIHSSSFTNSFKRCPSGPLPKGFAPNSTTKTCLVYLVPDHGTLTGVSFRPVQDFQPIVWSGTIDREHSKKKAKKKS